MNHNALENQIREAKERADMFSSSLSKAREQEGLFEEERQKWVLSFEEKSSMIEQLERELTCTVDALNQEKQEKTLVQKELIQSTWDVSHPRDSTIMRGGSTSSYNDRSNSRQMSSDKSYSRQEYTGETDTSSRRVLELLQQSQEETIHARRELSSMRLDRDRLSEQIITMKRQMDRVVDDKEQLAKSVKNSANKMHFRDLQVSEYELEKERHSRKEGELTDYISNIEKQLSSQRIDLARAASDLKAAATHRASLEQIIDVLTRKVTDQGQVDFKQVNSQSASSIQERFMEMEGIATELSHRTESAESSLRYLMGTTSADFDLPAHRAGAPDTAIPGSVSVHNNSSDWLGASGYSRGIAQFNAGNRDSSPTRQYEGIVSDNRRSKETDQISLDNYLNNQLLSGQYNPLGGAPYSDFRLEEMKLQRSSSTPPSVPKRKVKSKVKSKSAASTPVQVRGQSPITLISVKKVRATDRFQASVDSSDSKSSAMAMAMSHSHNLSLGSDPGYRGRETRTPPPRKTSSARARTPSISSEKLTRIARSSSQPVCSGRATMTPDMTAPSNSKSSSKPSKVTPGTANPRTKKMSSPLERCDVIRSNGMGPSATPRNTSRLSPKPVPVVAKKHINTVTILTPVNIARKGGTAAIPNSVGRYKLQVTIPSGLADFSNEDGDA